MKRHFIILCTCILTMIASCSTDKTLDPAGKPESDKENTEQPEKPAPETPETPDNPETPETPETPEPEVKTISILAIGNSFSVDAMEYLWGILDQAGYESITLGNLYIGGCSLETHANNFKNNSASYTYYTNTTGTWSNTKSYAPLNALKAHDWDIITMQQASGKSGVASTYEPYLSDLMAIVKANCPDAELAWHMTWAYQGNSTHNDFPTYGSNQMTMYNAIVSAVNSAVLPKQDIKKVIPNGTAVQNLRTSFIGDRLTRDGYHMSYDKGRYVTALTFAKSLTGCDLTDITYTPSSYTYTAEEITAMKEAADNACAKPYEVTVSAYPPAPEDPNRDYTTASLTDIISWKGYDPAKYEKLEIEMTKYAYYNSSNKTYLSTMYTQQNSTASNIKQFVATPIFEKADLPEGTLIVQRQGQQYRPEGWTALDKANTSATRPGNVTECLVEVDVTWWGNWKYRAFNLAKEGRPNLTDKTADELIDGFGIFIPKK